MSKKANGIAYQNKDIMSKKLAERFKGKSLSVYGLDIPDIKEVLPADWPDISADELRLDNVFLLKDDSIAIIDYESIYRENNKHKYIDYINRVTKQYESEWGRKVTVRMIVVYTGDVIRGKIKDDYDVGCLKLTTVSSFLSEFDPEGKIKDNLERKVKSHKKLTDEEIMQMIVLPLSYKGDKAKNFSIGHNIELIKNIKDDDTKSFILLGIAVFCDKVINKKYSTEIRRMLAMTKIGKMIADEMDERYESGRTDNAREIAMEMIRDGDLSEKKIAHYTGLSIAEIRRISKELKQPAMAL